MPNIRPDSPTSGVDCTARARASSMTSNMALSVKMGLLTTSGTMTRRLVFQAVPQAASPPSTEPKKRLLETAVRLDDQMSGLGVQDLDIAHIGPSVRNDAIENPRKNSDPVV